VEANNTGGQDSRRAVASSDDDDDELLTLLPLHYKIIVHFFRTIGRYKILLSKFVLSPGDSSVYLLDILAITKIITEFSVPSKNRGSRLYFIL
jgi:hypothetical protein